MKKTIWIVVAVVGISLLLWALASTNLLGSRVPRYWGMMGPGMMHNWGFGFLGWIGMILMWLIPISILVLVVLGIAGLFRGSRLEKVGGDVSQDQGEPHSPREILQIRYANGEITREQYLQMLEDLS